MTIAVRRVAAACFTAVTLPFLLPVATGSPGTLSAEQIFTANLPEDFLARGFAWSRDEKRLAYLVPQGAFNQLSLIAIDLPSAHRSLVLDPARLARVLRLSEQPRGNGPLSIAWERDGRTLVLGSAHAIVLLDVLKGRPRLLYHSNAPISDVTLSPDSQWISFVEKHDLQLIGLRHRTRRSLTAGGSLECARGRPDWLYSRELGLKTAHWWAPDAKSIAYLQFDESQVQSVQVASSPGGEPDTTVPFPVAGAKNPTVTLFTMPVAGGSPTRIADSGTGYLARVSWLPDGKRIAFELLNRAQNDLMLMMASVTGRDSSVLIEEHDAYWINLSDDLRFLSDGSGFVWSSERSGYRHLYLYDMTGRLQRQVTTGQWQVEGIGTVDEASRTIFFAANTRGPLERQLYRVALDGSGVKQITTAPGWHVGDFSPSGRYYVDTNSDLERPVAQQLARNDGGTPIQLGSNEPLTNLGLATLPKPELLAMRAHDGTPLDAMMIKPSPFDPQKKYPVLVFVAGGPGDQIVRNAWGGRIGLWHRHLATQGFVIFALDNRGSGGRNHLFEEPIHRRFSAIELSDQRDGITYLRRFPWVDTSRIGVWGIRYGGHMALHALFQDPQDFQVGFAASPIADWTLRCSAFPERYLHVPDGYSSSFDHSSVLDDAKAFRGKLLVAEDPQLPNQIKDVNGLMEAIGDRRNQVKLFLAPELDADEPDPMRAAAFGQAAEFFRRNLLEAPQKVVKQ